MNLNLDNNKHIAQLFEILNKEKIKNKSFSYEYDSQIKKITIRGATDFPSITNYSSQIKILDMSYGEMSSLPDDFQKMNNLEVLFLSFNNFTKIPSVISKIKNLQFLGMRSCKISSVEENLLPINIRWLTLTDNLIERLPKSIGKLKKLEKLLLAGNKITKLPEEIVFCENLALLRISANNLLKSPFPLLNKLPKLSWYSDAGNPFSIKKDSKYLIKKILWKDIKIKSIIGESAQSKIYQSSINNLKNDVAIKVFGNQITSDGYPQDDLLISVAAGTHPHLVQTIGEITGNPDNKKAIALNLIPSNFMKLGLPPSFKTCSRDTFPENKQFTIKYIFEILKSVSSAYRHLHKKEILNGDLYAHNILSNDSGYAYIGDFGAASFYDKKLEPNREFIDVRAFGILINDLITRCQENKNHKKLVKVKSIMELCLEKKITDRPNFKKINDLLTTA